MASASRLAGLARISAPRLAAGRPRNRKHKLITACISSQVAPARRAAMPCCASFPATRAAWDRAHRLLRCAPRCVAARSRASHGKWLCALRSQATSPQVPYPVRCGGNHPGDNDVRCLRLKGLALVRAFQPLRTNLPDASPPGLRGMFSGALLSQPTYGGLYEISVILVRIRARNKAETGTSS